ncbi:MAG: transglutaminase-like domain-containing protein [Bryobacteraceae bacterium]
MPLDRAALGLATLEFPGLEPEPFLEILDSHARELLELVDPRAPGEEFVAVANRYFFETCGFTGNKDDYDNPRNSCLNEVLLTRTGIPISLAVVYLEVGRRLHRPVFGVGMPGHFLVKYEDRHYTEFVDCFHGKGVTFEECRELALASSRIDIFAVPSSLAPVSNRQIIARMMNNLRRVYYKSGQLAKALGILDLCIDADPSVAEEYRQRGVLHMSQQHAHLALADFESYLRLAPPRDDGRDQIEEQVRQLRMWLG